MPSNKKKYLLTSEAYTCNPVSLRYTFKDEHLQQLYYKSNIAFLLDKISALCAKDEKVRSYLNDLGVQSFTSKKLAINLTASFMKKQTLKWVLSFYKFIRNEASTLWKLSFSTNYFYNKTTELPFRYAPIIKAENGDWCAPYNENDGLNVYLPLMTSTTEYKFIAAEYATNEEALAFFRDLGLKEPDKIDYIKTIFDKYNEYNNLDTETVQNDFEMVFQYYQDLKSQKEKVSFISFIKERITIANTSYNKMLKPHKIYDDENKLLIEFIKNYKETGVVDYACYASSVSQYGKEEVRKFMLALGVRTEPLITQLKYYNGSILTELQKKQLVAKNHTSESVEDFDIEGLNNLFYYSNKGKRMSIELSQYLWNFLTTNNHWHICKYQWRYYNWYHQDLESRLLERLKTNCWLLNGKMPSEVTQEDLLDAGYTYSKYLFDVLGIEKRVTSLKDLGASEEQIRNEGLGALAAKYGLTEEDLIKCAKEKNNRLECRDNNEKKVDSIVNDSLIQKGETASAVSLDTLDYKKKNEEQQTFLKREEVRKTELHNMFQTYGKHIEKTLASKEQVADNNPIDEIQQKLEEEVEKKNRLLELREIAATSPKYSKEWFDALLELEYKGSAEDKQETSNKTINISFSSVKKEEGTERIYVFSNPSRSIPLWIEEIENIEVYFTFNNRDEFKVKFEVANLRDFKLRLKASENYASILGEIDWSKCTKAQITLKNQIELIGKLRNAFNALNLPVGYNLKDNLSNHIAFIFGPPGTGKTTRLAENIIRLMANHKFQRILVLAPTNTACDEVAKKIIEKTDDYHWLARFVMVGDNSLEDIVASRESTIYKDKQCCLITTMARLTFDAFNGTEGPQMIKDMNWDLVICDEASMVPLAEMAFAIYQFKNTPILIAGDPMQIKPIVYEDSWKDENIYTMVNLDRFDNPRTEPIQFKIENLGRQYRSLPSIGELFNQYAYNGKLIHHRQGTEFPYYVFGELELKPVNFIPFKVERFDSIFGAKKLDGSNVHIYSVLLAIEMCKYICKEYVKSYTKTFNIGIICPYAPQAQLIESLISQIPDVPECISITVGTIHRFQGGQCNMIIAVFNPPRGLKVASDRIFLNNKNIINVAISRAQDYLCVLLPHCDTDGYEYLYELNTVGHIAMQNPLNVQTYTCDEVEEIIFGRKFYIENNTFVTSHQLTNVYTNPIKQYEIHIDENSVDIQIGKSKEWYRG